MSFLKWKGLKTIAICVLVAFATIALRVDLLAAPKAKLQPAVEKKVTSAAKFQDLLKDTEKLFEGMEADLGRKKDVSPRLAQLRQHRSDLQGLADNIRGDLAKTRAELISKKLPAEIIQRHDAFAQNFENNMKALLVDLDEAEQAKPGQLQVRVKAARDYLKKNIYRERHIPLDPNKLPHRRSDFKARKPITDPKEFKKLFPHTSAIPSATSNQHAALSLGDYLSRLLGIGIAYAQGEGDPNLAETIEVQFTQEIRDLAASLNHNPVKIYEYVRNNFEYEPYYGSLKGAQETLWEQKGNNFDQASLLIALLRVSNIPARYVYGTIELPTEKFMNWVGGFTNATTAVNFAASGGIPVSGLMSGGKVAKVRMEHIWVEAYIPYGNYRGSMRDDSIKTWIPLDPTFKQYQYKRGLDLYTALGINGMQYIMDYITDTSPSPIPAELQSQLPDYSLSPYQYYGIRLLNYIKTNLPYASNAELIGDDTIESSKIIVKKEYPYLPGSLPYQVITQVISYAAIPDTARHKISFAIKDNLTGETGLSYSTTLPEIAGKRVTLSYIPASPDDEALVTQYGGLLEVPAYLLQVKPVVKIEGAAVSTGQTVGLGYAQTFSMNFIIPNKGTDEVRNQVTAGDYSAIAIRYYNTPAEIAGENIKILIENAQNTAELDELLGQFLYSIGMSYLHHLNFEEELYAKNFQMVVTREPAEAIVTSRALTEWLYGVPYKVVEGGVGIDLDRDIKTPFAIDGSGERIKDYMIVSGLGSSAWENMILESFLDVPSASAAKMLKKAFDQGIEIYTIDNSNIETILPQLAISPSDKTNISNAVNAGKKVITPQTKVQYNEWNGLGYIVIDPNTGAAAYLISGGLAGAFTTVKSGIKLRLKADWSAYITSSTRLAVVVLAIAQLGTPYVHAGSNPDCGFDCSGLVDYVFTEIYSRKIWGGIRYWEPVGQYEYLRDHEKLLPYSERLIGDIVWKPEFVHTGILVFTSAIPGTDLIIHASGYPCKPQSDPKGWEPPPKCVVKGTEETKIICGKYKAIVITSAGEFAGGSGIHSEIGRPTLWNLF